METLTFWKLGETVQSGILFPKAGLYRLAKIRFIAVLPTQPESITRARIQESEDIFCRAHPIGPAGRTLVHGVLRKWVPGGESDFMTARRPQLAKNPKSGPLFKNRKIAFVGSFIRTIVHNTDVWRRPEAVHGGEFDFKANRPQLAKNPKSGPLFKNRKIAFVGLIPTDDQIQCRWMASPGSGYLAANPISRESKNPKTDPVFKNKKIAGAGPILTDPQT